MPGRVFLDVTYTRTQERPVGIPRTTRRLAQELPAPAKALGFDFAAVALDGTGFRQVPAMATHAPSRSAGGLLRLASGAMKPLVEQVLRLPWSVVQPLWGLAARHAYAAGTAGGHPVAFAPGDVLLLFDASWNYPLWPAARRARAAGARVVPLVHDLMPLESPQFCLPWVRSAFRHWLEQLVIASDAILCNSVATEASLRRWCQASGRLLPPTAVVRLGSDPMPAGPAASVRPGLQAFVAQAPSFACVGSVEPKKNHAALLAAFEILWQRGEPVRLVVAGRASPECAELATRMARMVNEGKPLLVLHDASDAEIDFLYRNARAMVLPSLFEGFGLPLVEARSIGCPVLASDIPAFRELADEGVCLFDPRSPEDLAQLVSEECRGQLLLSRRPAPLFGWADTAAQCLRHLQLLLSAASAAQSPDSGAPPIPSRAAP